MVSLLDIGGFQLHKWSANHPRILEGISNENKLADIFKIDKHNNCTIKTLGLILIRIVIVLKSLLQNKISWNMSPKGTF